MKTQVSRTTPACSAARSALLLLLALFAPFSYEAECCASIHTDCARRDLQTGCNACAGDHEAAAVTIREFTPPTSRPSPPPLRPTEFGCDTTQPVGWAAFGPCSVPASPVEGGGQGRASRPLFILHSSLLV